MKKSALFIGCAYSLSVLVASCTADSLQGRQRNGFGTKKGDDIP